MTKLGQDRPARIRRTAYFSGRVQGVGFRYTTQHIASRFNVTGLVRNMPDGRVELVAEGGPSDLDNFQLAIEQAMSEYIRATNATDSAASGEFSSFRIAL